MAHSHELESIRDFPKITSAASALGLPSTFVTLDYLADSKKKKETPSQQGKCIRDVRDSWKERKCIWRRFPCQLVRRSSPRITNCGNF